MRHFLFLLLLFFVSGKAFAGWFECYSFKGKLAGADIHMYIQLMKIHSNNKDSTIVIGLYKYDKINTPIKLRGAILNDRTLKLTEYHNEEPSAQMVLNWGSNHLEGTWEGPQRSYSIQLQKVGYLSDLDFKRVNEPTEILMESSSSEEYLVGVYSKKATDLRAKMTSLHVIDKKTNEIRQLIKFDESDLPIGNIMTEIFSNISMIKSPKSLLINVDDGHMGGSYFMTYNESLQKYIKD